MSLALTIFHGTIPLAVGPFRHSDPEDGVLDTFSQDWLAPYPNWKAALASEGIVKNNAYPGYPRMFITGFDIEQEDEARCIVSVRGSGLLASGIDKRIREISSQGRIISIGPIGEEGDYDMIGTPSGSSERWNINDPNLSLTDSYFATEEPDQSEQGTAIDPPSPPDPPAWLWSGYTGDMRANHPNGWVLDQRQVSEIIKGKLWSVRDFFVYYHPSEPA